MKTYHISENCTLTLRKIMTNDAIRIIEIFKAIDRTEEQSLLDFILSIFENGLIDELGKLVLAGDFPDGKVGDWLPLETALEVAEDFLSDNKMLASKLRPLLARFTELMTEGQPSSKADTKTDPASKTAIRPS